MGAQEITLIVTWLLNQAFIWWEKAREIGGVEEIPSWEELTDKNARLQAKIDAEME